MLSQLILVSDESVDVQITKRLVGVGYQVFSVTEISPAISDTQVLDLANQHQALLLTADKDFGELIYRLKKMSYGIVLIRLAGLSTDDKATIVLEAFQRYDHEMNGAFTVIGKNAIRIRTLKQLVQE